MMDAERLIDRVLHHGQKSTGKCSDLSLSVALQGRFLLIHGCPPAKETIAFMRRPLGLATRIT